jgi:hypothetical protein
LLLLIALQDQLWEFGTINYHVQRTYSELVLQSLISGLSDATLRLNWPVKSIGYTSHPAANVSHILRAARAVSTLLPIPCLGLAHVACEAVSAAVDMLVTQPKIAITSESGQTIEADRVVVTVPLTVLQVCRSSYD